MLPVRGIADMQHSDSARVAQVMRPQPNGNDTLQRRDLIEANGPDAASAALQAVVDGRFFK